MASLEWNGTLTKRARESSKRKEKIIDCCIIKKPRGAKSRNVGRE
jgi:hypothetical protein